MTIDVGRTRYGDIHHNNGMILSILRYAEEDETAPCEKHLSIATLASKCAITWICVPKLDH